MSIKRFAIISSCSAMLLATACTPGKEINDIEGQYWQRANVSESTWLQGPKAQQSLNRDIARCVTELRELERLGAIKNGIPTDRHGRVLDPDPTKLDKWDTPSHDESLLIEHVDYHDFEGCMLDKGWERVKFVGFRQDLESRQNYLRAHVDYKYQSRVENEDHKRKEPDPKGPYETLNE